MILDKDFSLKKSVGKSLKKSTASIMGSRSNKSRQLNLLNDREVKKDNFFRS